MVGVHSTALIFVGLLNIALALFVLLRNSQKVSNVAFAMISLGLGGWCVGIAGFMISSDPDIAKVWAKVYYFFPQLVAVSIAVFAFSFGTNSTVSRRIIAPLLLGFFVVTVPLVFVSSFLTKDIVYHDWGKEIVLNKVHYLMYSLYLLACLSVAQFVILVKSKRLSGIDKSQAKLFFFGFSVTGILGVTYNLIYPWFGNYRMIWLGPLFTGAFIISISYSMVRYKMFDIRLAVARTLGYVLSVIVLSLVYGFITFNLVNSLLFRYSDVSVWQKTVYTLLAVVIAFTFQPLKRFFDKWSNRFFYQDAYDPQVLVHDLNKAIVSTIDLNKMLRVSTEVIGSNIKPEFCAFGLKETDTRKQRIIGDVQQKFSSQDVDFARVNIPALGRKVIVADHLDAEYKSIQSKMRKNGVAVLVRLTTDLSSEGVGYIILGPKKSGGTYNSQDVQVLETIANSLVIAIDNALRFEEIQNFNISLRNEVEQATKRLQRANDKLVALDQTKDDFISMASHQLRTPLTSVKGYISMVLEGDAGKINNDQKELLNQAFVSSQRMVYLISDLLNVSRLKTGKFVIEASPINLADVVDSEVAQLKETATARGLKFIYKKPKDFPTLMLDETKIRQVLTNYMDNAIYYTPKGGRIDIELKNGRETIEFTVKDNGIGIPKDEQHNLFTKFYRAGNAKKARPDGTGLGLFMAKKVVIAQGGATIFSSAEGKGSTFGFSFSKSRLRAAK